jgi:serine/threonine protein kinase
MSDRSHTHTNAREFEQAGRDVLLDIGAALQYLHEEKQIAHLDVKPENILFAGNSRVDTPCFFWLLLHFAP